MRNKKPQNLGPSIQAVQCANRCISIETINLGPEIWGLVQAVQCANGCISIETVVLVSQGGSIAMAQ